MPTSARLEVANSLQITVKTVQSAGSMCTGKRQTHIRNAPSSRTAVTGIGTYEAYKYSARRFELFQISRERSKKTEAVFLVGSRRPGGKSKSPRARFLLPAFSFGEAKENAEGQLQVSNTGSYIVMCIIDHKNSTDSPKDFQLSPLPAATPQALRAGSP